MGNTESLNAPTWLDKRAKEYWRRVAPSLVKDNVLNKVTYDLIACAAKAYSVYRNAVETLEEQGRVITTPSGTVKQNAWCAVEKQAFETLARVYRELKLSGSVAEVKSSLDKMIEEDD